jgi:hypothetical protein
VLLRWKRKRKLSKPKVSTFFPDLESIPYSPNKQKFSGPTCSQEIVVVALGRDLRYMSKILHIIYLSTWHLPCDDSTDFSHVLQYFVACVHSIPDPMVTSCVIIIPHYSRSSLCYIHRHQMLVGYMKVLVSNYRHRPTTRHTYSCSVHDIQD